MPVRLSRSEARERNRQALLRAAREVVVEQGYAGTQLDAVAAKAGLTKGAVYSIFGSKLDLLVAVVEDVELEVVETLLPTIGSLPTAEDVLEVLTDRFLAMQHSTAASSELSFQLELLSLALREPRLHSAALTSYDRNLSRLVDLLVTVPTRDGRRLGRKEAEQVARLAAAVLQGLMEHAVLAGWVPPRELVRTLVVAPLQTAVMTRP